MELPSDYLYFWHTQVLPGKPCIIEVPKDADCSITNIALHQTPEEIIPPESRVNLFISVNNSDPVAIAPFLGGHFESTLVDLRFSEQDKIILTLEGNEIPVDIVGHYLGLELRIDNGAPPPPPPQPPIENVEQDAENVENVEQAQEGEN